MNKSEPIPYSCPGCGAKYDVVVDAPADTQSERIACWWCGFPFPACEGATFLRYLPRPPDILQREPLPLYCHEHDKWQRQHDVVTDAWRDAWCDVLATVPATRQGAIALIDAFLLYQEADTDRSHYLELLARLRAFLQTLP